MGWGRYSGFFFYKYKGNSKIQEGPFETRLDAEAWAFQARDLEKCRTGKIFQKEKPVRF